MLARIRKAVVAGLGAGVTGAAGVIATAIKTNTLGEETVQQAIGAFIAGAAVIGWAAWRVPNAEVTR